MESTKTIISKSTTQSIREDIQYIDIISGYVAVNRKVFVDGKLMAEDEYISTSKSAMSESGFISLKPDLPPVMPRLYDKAIIEALRTTPYYDMHFKNYVKVKPFTILRGHPLTDYELLFRDDNNYTISDLDGEPLPNAIMFNGIVDSLTSELYNLRKVGYILKHRNDIVFKYKDDSENIFASVYPNNLFAEKGNVKKVETIIPFMWVPSNKEDWRKYVAFCKETSVLDGIKREYVDDKAYVLSNILGLDVARKDY